MDKKGRVFLPLMIIGCIVLFTYMGFKIVEHNQERENKYVEAIGYTPLALLKVYDEGERASLYLTQAGEYASVRAEKSVAGNGGYSDDTSCKKTKNGFVIWNSCPVLDPESAYNVQFQKELSKYLAQYSSVYSPFAETKALENIRKNKGLSPEDIGVALIKKYTDAVKAEKVSEVKTVDNKIVVSFEPLNFPIEYASKDSVYTKEVKFSTPKQDFEVYNLVYNDLASCLPPIAQFSREECRSELANDFPGIKMNDEESLVDVEYKDLRFAFDPKLNLPERVFLKSIA